MTAGRCSWFNHAFARMIFGLVLGAMMLSVVSVTDTVGARSTFSHLTHQSEGGDPPAHPFGEPSAPLVDRHVYDLAAVLSAEELRVVEADARRLQRHGLPVLVITAISDMSRDDAARITDAVRQDWSIASETGADDGLVFLVVLPHTVDRPPFTTLSWGDNSLPNEGLLAADADQIQELWIEPPVADSQVSDALTLGLRRMIYHSIYDPAPAAPLSDAQESAQAILTWSAPLVAVGYVVALGIMRTGAVPMSRTGWPPRIVPFAVVLLLGAVSVWSYSTIGIVCTAVVLAGALVSWVRSDPGHQENRVPAPAVAAGEPAGKGV